MFDDPLASVDAHVGKSIWKDVIMGYLRNNGKTVLIVSHQTQYFSSCDSLILIEDGHSV